MIKILHITEGWRGGIATYVTDLIKYQNSINSKTPYKIDLLYAENLTDTLPDIPQVGFHEYISSRNPIKVFKVARLLKKKIKELAPDIIHLHSTFPGIYGRLLTLRNSQNKKIPIIYCPHGWSFTQDVHWISKKIYIAVEKFLGQKTEAIINISQNEARVASKYKVQAKHYNSTILSCVRDTQYTNLAPLFKVNQEKINIGFMGRFDQQKGFDFLLNQTFINSNNKLVLYVVGDFDREKNNKKLPLPQYPNIIHLGWIDHTRVDDYISQLDALIIPSRWEGFGLVTIEAMRNSKAIIISNRGALNEMVIENYNGYIFSLDTPESLENIINKLKKPELLRMGQNSRKIYEQSFSGNRQNQEINELYEKVLSIV